MKGRFVMNNNPILRLQKILDEIFSNPKKIKKHDRHAYSNISIMCPNSHNGFDINDFL